MYAERLFHRCMWDPFAGGWEFLLLGMAIFYRGMGTSFPMVTPLPRDGIHFSTGGEPLFRAMGFHEHTKELGHTKELEILILVTCSGYRNHRSRRSRLRLLLHLSNALEFPFHMSCASCFSIPWVKEEVRKILGGGRTPRRTMSTQGEKFPRRVAERPPVENQSSSITPR